MSHILEPLKVIHNTLAKTVDNFMIQGLKALILDKITMQFLTLSTTQTALEKELFVANILIENIVTHQSSPNITAVFFITPTDENISILTESLKSPKFQSYYINFTMDITEQQQKLLAQSDLSHVVQSFRVLYSSFYPVHHNFFETPQGVNSFVSFVKAYGCQPAVIRYMNTGKAKAAATKIAVAFQNSKQLPYDQLGQQPNKESRDPVQILVVDKAENLQSIFQPYLTLQSVINSAFRVGTTGRAGDIPHSYFTTPNRFRMLFDIDSFKASDILQQQIEFVQKESAVRLDTSMSPEEIQKQLEKSRVLEEMQTNILNLGKLRKDPRYQMVQTYCTIIQQANIDLLEEQKNPSSMVKIIQSYIQEFSVKAQAIQNHDVPDKQKIIQILCMALLCMISNLNLHMYNKTLKRKQDEVDKCMAQVSKYTNEAFQVFVQIEPSMEAYVKRYQDKIATLKLDSQVDWQEIIENGIAAESLIADNKMIINFQRPDFMTLLEEEDLLDTQHQTGRRYQVKPNIVSLAESALLYTLNESICPILDEFSANYQKFKSEQVMTTTIIYQVGGATFDDACALGNWSYYGHQRPGKEDDKFIECSRLTNSQILLATDKVETFFDIIEKYCDIDKSSQAMEGIAFV